jgi:hypothetical protein
VAAAADAIRIAAASFHDSRRLVSGGGPVGAVVESIAATRMSIGTFWLRQRLARLIQVNRKAKSRCNPAQQNRDDRYAGVGRSRACTSPAG